ncbi:MAG: hypothetical protein KAI24_11730, partial [Planctomycetes bacterium]|nr:hypothetical protein [Planctomycetota bacterium]
MAAEPAQPVPKWWRWTSAEVPADAVGIALRFAVSRNHLDLHGVTASPALAGIARDVRHRTVTLRWPAEGHPAGALTLVAPYAGARPDLAEHRWVRAGDPPAPIAAHPPEELIIERVRRARALPPQAADRDAHVFFAELDAATIPHLERSVEFPEVNAGRL